ncbi:killer cell lectin-like receptor subfamily B member 1B allele C [Pelodiscus sinensis]|uniref:killer cell lectin-like receptor subfamily B member 1B allele C n=1 Tax=Pelodiscus sinensis TaxID=13735 RepID=UPI003F6B83B0
MAGEVVYADLNIPGAGSSSRPPQCSQNLSSPPCPQWCRIAVGVKWAGIIFLVIAVIALGAWVSQLHGSCEEQSRGAQNTSEKNETRIVNSTEGSSSLEDFRSRLKSILCEPPNGSSSGGAGCKLCPTDWLLRGDKCYWLSKGPNNWNWSRDDCWGKRSRLLVLQSQEELDFIQNVTQDGKNIWIGLKVTPPGGKWTWVDGSPLDPARFPVSGSVDGNSCGCIRGRKIQSETCGATYRWICQKEASMI